MSTNRVMHQRPSAARAVATTTRGLLGVGIPGLLMMGVFSLFVVAEAGAESATEAMQGTLDRVLQVLGDASLKGSERSRERLNTLERIIEQRFDYKEMGKRTLGRHWGTLDATQRTEFVRLFQRFLSHTYARNVDSYSGEQITYLKERRKGEFAEVQTKVVSNDIELLVNYRLLKRSNSWKVYDVVIDGISLVKNFRGQFDRIIKAKSVAGLFEKLRSKLSSP